MTPYRTNALWILDLYLLAPASSTEFWVKLCLALLAGAVLLNLICSAFRMGNPDFASAVVMFSMLGLVMLCATTVLQVHLGHLLRGQDKWVSAVLWTLASSLLLVAPILRKAWPGGYVTALICWIMTWAGVLLVLFMVEAGFSAVGAGKNVVRKEGAHMRETREFLNLAP